MKIPKKYRPTEKQIKTILFIKYQCWCDLTLPRVKAQGIQV